MKVELTKEQCKNVAEFIGDGLIDTIRTNEWIDNINWVRDMITAMDTLNDAAED